MLEALSRFFWPSVACSRIAAKVGCESLPSQSKEKHTNAKAVLSLLWCGMVVILLESL